MKLSLQIIFLLVLSVIISSAPDPNFYIFLAFGGSNMEGQGDIEQEDINGVTDKFKIMPAIDIPQQDREAFKWYKAVPPLCRQNTHLSPVDNFGRTLIDNLPEYITVGVINVAVAGSSIDLFDEDKLENYINNADDSVKEIAALYGNNPYKALINAAKKAQESGIIKGILLHQGEFDIGVQAWSYSVKKVYEKMLSDLDLKADEVPLLVGELLREDEGGKYYALNNDELFNMHWAIQTSHIISSEECTSKGDGIHFDSAGYRLLGRRYAKKWLELNGYEIKEIFNPNFYIFLAFGQSNMEGQGTVEEEDKEGIPNRFRMMSTVEFQFNPEKRVPGEWYKAVPPLCREFNGIGPCDYFGRTLLEKLPKNIRVGVINVSVAGCSIVLYDEDRAESYLTTTPGWLNDIAKIYNNNPFRELVKYAKKAQEAGVIKGILLHQGESDNGDPNWPNNVKLIYDRLLEELNLKEEDVPLLVGELVSNEEGGLCYQHNEIIGNINQVIKNSYVISSEGCTSKNDGYHFNTAGYRTLGKRFGEVMYEYLKNHNDTNPN